MDEGAKCFSNVGEADPGMYGCLKTEVCGAALEIDSFNVDAALQQGSILGPYLFPIMMYASIDV